MRKFLAMAGPKTMRTPVRAKRISSAISVVRRRGRLAAAALLPLTVDPSVLRSWKPPRYRSGLLTPPEKVTIMHEAFAALERHDLDACMSMMTPDFIVNEPQFSGDVKRYSGAENSSPRRA